MRTKMIAGNWKMNTTLADAHVLANGIRQGAEHLDHVDIVLCPPSIWLTELAHHGIGPGSLKHLKLGAQNMYFEEHGTFTGEISPLMVREVAEYVIVGHSERTHVFNETPDLIVDKVESALAHDLTPILCVGEDVQEEGSKKKLVQQLNFLIRDLEEEDIERIIVAYEPVWAISTGPSSQLGQRAATPEYAQEIISALRTVLPAKTRILYGGSANEENCQGYLTQTDIDGLLVGGASLKLKSFLTMCEIANNISIPSK
jgi:triosephosphate isomerase